ncbi:MAG: hypothetical protein JSV91_09465, partial [Phycisphaerales bacterium]
YGQNYPWIFSRYEHSVQTTGADETEDFLRAMLGRAESSEYLEQLPNYALLLDNRRKLTCFNGARNDEMPPWLRWRWQALPPEIPQASGNNFLAQAMRKVDLREPNLTPAEVVNLNNQGLLAMPQRLPYTLMLALMDAYFDSTGAFNGHSYLGDIVNGAGQEPSGTLQDIRRLAAGWAANILAWRDADSYAPLQGSLLDRAVPLPALGPPPYDEDRTTRFLGLEPQPFLVEAFIAHVYASEPLPDPPPGLFPLHGYPGNYVDDSHNKTSVVVVQIANPFNEPIELSQYKIRVGVKSVALSGTLYPAREDYPVTGIFYAIEDDFTHDTLGDVDFDTPWLDFLDLTPNDHPPDTIRQSVLSGGPFGTDTWSTDPEVYYNLPDEPHRNIIELIRTDYSTGQMVDVVVDRFDYDEDHDPASERDEFKDEVEDMSQPPTEGVYEWGNDQDPTSPRKPGIRIDNNNWWVTWVRVTRAWGWDVDGSGLPFNQVAVDRDEKAPRFVYARQGVRAPDPTDDAATKSEFEGDVYQDPNESYIGNAFVDIGAPETPWFTRTFERKFFPAVVPPPDPITRKPTFFDMYRSADFEYQTTGGWSYPDKGFYGTYGGGTDFHYRGSLQMLQKNADFETIGELRHVFLSGHELAFIPPGGPGGAAGYDYTKKTFSEFMWDPLDEANPELSAAINRIGSGDLIGRIGANDTGYSLFHPLHAVPDLPAGLRVFDAFVCDGYGYNVNPVGEMLNAAGFSRRGTVGLVNLNTAPPEVMRALPHWYKMVHEVDAPDFNPRVALPEAVVQYRERYRNVNDFGLGYEDTVLPIYNAPDYHSRGTERRGDRGLASIGELLLVTQDSLFDIPTGTGLGPGGAAEYLLRESWRLRSASQDPFGYVARGLPLESTRISTDLQGMFDSYPPNPPDGPRVPDETAGDLEEYNLLFSGASNLVTTRSDVFTIYFKIRSFRQNPNTGIWDATDPEYIVDESRWVMQVDRSEVNQPSDKPKILFLEKLPN